MDHAIRISNQYDFIENVVLPELMNSIDLPSIPNYEARIRGQEKRAGLRLFVLGAPILLMFLGIPFAALLYAVSVAPSPTNARFLVPAIVSFILLAVFFWLWFQTIGRGAQLWIKQDAPASEVKTL
jgi:hypothetical protein